MRGDERGVVGLRRSSTRPLLLENVWKDQECDGRRQTETPKRPSDALEHWTIAQYHDRTADGGSGREGQGDHETHGCEKHQRN